MLTDVSQTRYLAWVIRFFAVLVLAILLWLLLRPATPVSSIKSPPQSHIVSATVSSLNASAPVRVTVYQQSDAAGIASFSDRADRGQPRVIDHSKGTTYQSTYGGQVPNTASLSYTPAEPTRDPIERLKQDHTRFQQQVQHAKQQRVQAAINE